MSPSELVVELASDSPGPFEGPEKLLELWFAPSEQDVASRGLELRGGRVDKDGKKSDRWVGLRQVERKVLDSMLDEVQCKVLSVIEGEECDAYLLSESSMFVWPHKLILKTCGTTTLLLGLPSLLRIASETCSFGGVWRCFYSRKTFMFPDRQRGPHKDWTQETDFLDKLFENSSAYTVGRMNGDHWLLYLTPPQDDVLAPNALASSFALAPAEPSLPLAQLSESLSTALISPSIAAASTSPNSSYFHTPASTNGHSTAPTTPPHRVPARPDQTLEILMSRLSSKACASFYHPSSSPSSSSNPAYTSPLYASDPSDADAHALGSALSKELGITDLLPEATLDSFLFSPCGYSSNAVQGDRYATIHVTPEEEYSYASFETNVDFSSSTLSTNAQSLPSLVQKVLKIFEPAKLSMTLFVSMDEDEDEEATRAKAHQGMKELLSPELLERYNVVDRIMYEFSGYQLAYVVVHEK